MPKLIIAVLNSTQIWINFNIIHNVYKVLNDYFKVKFGFDRGHSVIYILTSNILNYSSNTNVNILELFLTNNSIYYLKFGYLPIYVFRVKIILKMEIRLLFRISCQV